MNSITDSHAGNAHRHTGTQHTLRFLINFIQAAHLKSFAPKRVNPNSKSSYLCWMFAALGFSPFALTPPFVGWWHKVCLILLNLCYGIRKNDYIWFELRQNKHKSQIKANAFQPSHDEQKLTKRAWDDVGWTWTAVCSALQQQQQCSWWNFCLISHSLSHMVGAAKNEMNKLSGWTWIKIYQTPHGKVSSFSGCYCCWCCCCCCRKWAAKVMPATYSRHYVHNLCWIKYLYDVHFSPSQSSDDSAH